MSFVWLDDAFDLIQQRTNKIVVGFYRRPFQSRSSKRWRKLGICLNSRLSRQNPRKRRGKRTEEKRGIRSKRRKNNNSKVGGGRLLLCLATLCIVKVSRFSGGVRDLQGRRTSWPLYSLKFYALHKVRPTKH